MSVIGANAAVTVCCVGVFAGPDIAAAAAAAFFVFDSMLGKLYNTSNTNTTF